PHSHPAPAGRAGRRPKPGASATPPDRSAGRPECGDPLIIWIVAAGGPAPGSRQRAAELEPDNPVARRWSRYRTCAHAAAGLVRPADSQAAGAASAQQKMWSRDPGCEEDGGARPAPRTGTG